MNLEKYISDLLYRYDCVIVPDFGGFVANKISAQIATSTYTFYPPKKQLSFNSQLKNNDGLLANYISSVEKISFNEVLQKIESQVSQWNSKLESEVLQINKIGTLVLSKEKKLLFEPSNSINYLAASFGLDSYDSEPVKRKIVAEIKPAFEKPKKIEVFTPTYIKEENDNNRIPLFIKFAATAAIVFALGSVGWGKYQNDRINNLALENEIVQQNVEKQIQEATFVIENPLPAINIEVSRETYNYHIIGGAFRNPKNAEKRVEKLIQKGYKAKVLGVNKYNLTPVSYGSFKTKTEALKSLQTIKKTDSKDAWLLFKKQ